MKRTLYLLHSSPQTRSDRLPILETAGSDDAVLLHQDGVLGLYPLHPSLDRLARAGVRIVACEPDCRARGVKIPDDAVEWAGFVRLIADYERVVS